MADKPAKVQVRENPDGSQSNPESGRRSFMKSAATAGLLGAAGITPGLVNSGSAPQMPGPPDPQMPTSGLRPQAQLDARFPVTFENTIPETMRVITGYFAALSRRDLPAMARTLHFPFATYDGCGAQLPGERQWTEAVVFNSAEELIANPPPSMNVTGKGTHMLKPGAFDILDNLELVVYNPVGAGLSMSYSRFGADGRKLLVCRGIYCITNNDGKWGVHMISTIFTPADQAAVVYNDATEGFLRNMENVQLAFSHRDQVMLSAVQGQVMQIGMQAHVNIGNPRNLSGNARAGKPLDEYRIKGVTNRLTFGEVTEEQLAKPHDNNIPQFVDWAGGTVGPCGYTMDTPNCRVLHFSPDKIHVFGGYRRYTLDGTLISETHAVLGAFTYKKGRWGMAGWMGEMMYHDRSNDVHT
jgi:hypothetical protein